MSLPDDTRIAFDGSILGDGTHTTGVGRAFVNTLVAYSRQQHADGEDPRRHHNPLTLFVHDTSVADAFPELPESIRLVEGAPRSALDRFARFRQRLRSERITLLHSPITAIPGGAPCRVIATVHDLPWMAGASVDDTSRLQTLRARAAVRMAARRAHTILCVSRTTRRDLVHFLGRRPRARVRVSLLGAQPPTAPLQDTAERQGPLLAFLDGSRRRKNTPRVLRAHARAQASTAGDAIPPLHWIGPPDHFVSEATKSALMASGRGLIHATLADGFGMPVAEALRHRLPVVCSNRGSLPEIAPPGTALHVDPENEAELADAIVRLCTDFTLREQLVTAGSRRAKDLLPEHTAAVWRRVHEDALR